MKPFDGLETKRLRPLSFFSEVCPSASDHSHMKLKAERPEQTALVLLSSAFFRFRNSKALEEKRLLMEGPSERDTRSERITSKASLLQWSQWQLLDSILPTGGFAHSFGLEAAVQARLVSSPEDVQTYIIHVLDNTGSLLLPFVYSTTKSPDIETWHKLDRMLNATLTNEVSRKASISQGSALLRVAASVFTEIPNLKTIRDASLGTKNVSFHHAPVFGLICGLLGMDSETSQRAYLFVTLRDVVSAATRLNLVGPIGASVMQHRVAVIGEAVLEKWKDRVADEACQTSPLLDAVQGCHSYLFSRLFCS